MIELFTLSMAATCRDWEWLLWYRCSPSWGETPSCGQVFELYLTRCWQRYLRSKWLTDSRSKMQFAELTISRNLASIQQIARQLLSHTTRLLDVFPKMAWLGFIFQKSTPIIIGSSFIICSYPLTTERRDYAQAFPLRQYKLVNEWDSSFNCRYSLFNST